MGFGVRGGVNVSVIELRVGKLGMDMETDVTPMARKNKKKKSLRFFIFIKAERLSLFLCIKRTGLEA